MQRCLLLWGCVVLVGVVAVCGDRSCVDVKDWQEENTEWREMSESVLWEDKARVAPKSGGVSPGLRTACWIREDGKVVCADLPLNGNGKVRASVIGAMISCSTEACCAIDEGSGRAYCWSLEGKSLEGMEEPIVQVSVARGVACGITARKLRIKCWELEKQRNAANHPLMAFPTLSSLQISCGNHHCCAIVQDNLVSCWGENIYGELNVPIDLRATQLSAAQGGHFTLSLDMEGKVNGWGQDSFGQISHAPKNVVFREVSAGDQFSCGLGEPSGQLVCWGRTAHLALGRLEARFPEPPSFAGLQAGKDALCVTNSTARRYLCLPSLSDLS